MIEIRFHGRGGQGAVIGSEVLAHAMFLEGNFVQAFPSFGVERRGAPVTAFCRADAAPILLRNQIYRPDHVIVLDASLLHATAVCEGLKPGGCLVINSPRGPAFYRSLGEDGFKVYVVDASALAVAHGLGSPASPIVNTAVVGAYAAATGSVGLVAVQKAIWECVRVHPQANQKAARAAFHAVRPA